VEMAENIEDAMEETKLIFVLIYRCMMIQTDEALLLTDISDINDVSLVNDGAVNITGRVLFFSDKESGRFEATQRLEGCEAEVRKLYAKIKNDSRAEHYELISTYRIKTRAYTNWSSVNIIDSPERERDLQMQQVLQKDPACLGGMSFWKIHNRPATILPTYGVIISGDEDSRPPVIVEHSVSDSGEISTKILT